MLRTTLQFSGVTFAFSKQTPLFENFSCSLTKGSDCGKIIALMGSSGVGKTTFCDLALRIRDPQSGFVNIEPTTANIAVIPQKGIIFDELSVEENISCLQYSKSLGKTFRKEKVRSAVESLGLASVLKNGTRASSLSGGEAQRVMLARIQTVDCEVLILDEPCSFLDNRVKGSFLSALREVVNERRFLALMVTHVWDEARLVADEAVFFHRIPGKPVTAHCCPIDEAERYPPNIDALFGIHWPQCAVFPVNEVVSVANSLRIDIQSEARFVGVYRDNSRASKTNDWSTGFWDKGSNPEERLRLLLDHGDQESIKQFLAATVLYDADGIALTRSRI